MKTNDSSAAGCCRFEAALDGALKSEQDNILLRQQLMMAETEKVNAVDSVRAFPNA